jgi:hypothetical protein
MLTARPASSTAEGRIRGKGLTGIAHGHVTSTDDTYSLRRSVCFVNP